MIKAYTRFALRIGKGGGSRAHPGRAALWPVSAGAVLALACLTAPQSAAQADSTRQPVRVADGYTPDMVDSSKKPVKVRPATRSGSGRTSHSTRPAAKPAPSRAGVPTGQPVPGTGTQPRDLATPGTGPAAGGTKPGAMSPPPEAAQSGPAGLISVNFQNVDVRQALATIGEYARIDILVTPGSSGTVSVNLRSRTPDESVRLVAAAGGLSVVRVGESYVVGPAAEVKQATAGFGTTEVVALRWAKPEDAKQVVSRVAPLCTVESGRNSVMLTGLPADVQAARQALTMLDVEPPKAPDPKPETDLAVVRNADPSQVEEALRRAFPQLQVARAEKVLTITGSREELDVASRAIQALDVAPPPKPVEVAQAPVPPPPPPTQTTVYRLKYLTAKTTAEMLSKLYPNLIVAAGPEPTAPPAAGFQPLSISFMGSGSEGGGFNFSSSSSGFGSSTTTNSAAPAQVLSRSTQVVLSGPAPDVAAATALLAQTDVAPPLVRIQASLIEVSKTNLEDLGIQWDFSNTGTTMTVPGGKGLDFGDIRFTDLQFSVALRALITRGQARILASPNISVVDNEDANIFIGDLIRFRGVNVVSPNVGTVQGTQTIPVGIALLVRPRIHPEGEVTLKVHPVVSTISSFVDGLPQTSSREADTTVRLARGEQLVIGGLDRTERIRDERRVPLLGDIPVVGELFRSRSTRSQDTEIVVIIRAYAANTEPAPANQFTVPAGAMGGGQP